MVLYTPLPLELVLEGIDQARDYREVNLNGMTVVLERIEEDQGRIVRLLSTDPKDFLNPRYQPGSIVSLKLDIPHKSC